MAKRRNQVNLQIWCSPELRNKFKKYCVLCGFKNYEEALQFLLSKADELKLKPQRGKLF